MAILAEVAKRLCTYKATVAYDGTAYKGFQLQNPPDKNKRTIQGELEGALTMMFNVDRRALRMQGAGRTDSGVHARGQVFHRLLSIQLLTNLYHAFIVTQSTGKNKIAL